MNEMQPQFSRKVQNEYTRDVNFRQAMQNSGGVGLLQHHNQGYVNRQKQLLQGRKTTSKQSWKQSLID